MSTRLNDIIVHLDETLDEYVLKGLEEMLRQLEGVISVAHTPGRNHLLAVVYNSDITKEFDILQRVRDRGVHAELVGM